MSDARCEHVSEIDPNATPDAEGFCPDCVREGTRWVHLRVCAVCGHVGCCDSSPSRHARAHFHETGHPIIRSAERGEDWMWCYEHNAYCEPDGKLG